MIAKDFDFHGILTAYLLSEFHDHGSGRDAAGTTRMGTHGLYAVGADRGAAIVPVQILPSPHMLRTCG
jgi:hypothetical protein